VTLLMIVVSAAPVAFDFQNLLARWHGRLVQPGERASPGRQVTTATDLIPILSS